MKSTLIHFLIGLMLAGLAGLFAATQAVQAGQRPPIEFPLTQPDGTPFTARQWGDEWNHGYETLEGYSILQCSDDWWVYAIPQSDGSLGPSLGGSPDLRVGVDNPDGLPLHLRPAALNINPHSVSVIFADGIHAPEYQNIGNEPVLVILAQYSDHPGSVPAANFASQWFGPSNSIRDFYLDNSINQLTLTAINETSGAANDGVVGWLTLGATRQSSTLQIAKDAILQADPYVNFANYNTNPVDGYISQWELHVFVILAGHEGSYDDTTPAIWAQNTSLEAIGAPSVDGVVVADGNHSGSYSVVGELHGEHQATIGIQIHELGHDMSNPDLYDISGNSAGVGNWSVQGSGNWNSAGGEAGSSPAFFDPWIKSYQGWITPINVDGTLTNQAIPQAETSAVAYRLRPNPGGVDWEFYQHSGTGEYFLVENRQNDAGAGYDDGLPGCGLLIWHIDESVTFTNEANADRDHPLVWVEQADGVNQMYVQTNRGDAGDPWPGSSARYDFNSGTTPNSNLYSGVGSAASVHVDSTTCSGSMQADLVYAPPPPGAFGKNSPSDGTGPQNVTISLDWGNSSGATSYDYCLETPANGACTTWTTGLTGSHVTVARLVNSATYEWQVRAVNGNGSTLANSGALWIFYTNDQVKDEETFLPLLHSPLTPPGAFGKTTPVDLAADIPTSPTLDWGDASRATSYEYCYDTNLNGSCSGTWNSSGAASQVSLSGLAGSTTHEWQVRAVNSTGTPTYANGGTLWRFTTATPPGPWTEIMSEEFESTFPGPGWSVVDLDGSTNGEYFTGKRNCNVQSGSYSGWMVGGGANGSGLPCGSNYPALVNTRFIYGPFSTVGASAGQLKFNFYMNVEPGLDMFYIDAYSSDGPYYGDVFSDRYDLWYGYTLDLTRPICDSGTASCMNRPQVWIRFGFYSDTSVAYPHGVILDHIRLRLCFTDTCLPPSPEFEADPAPPQPLPGLADPFLMSNFK